MTQTTGDVRALDDGTPPTVADVDRIAAHTDPVVRNLQITHCYHQLSRALAQRTGGSANWCTFAVWASKQVGQTIRQEDPARLLERMLATSPDIAAGIDLLVRALRRAVPQQTLDHAEQAVRRTVVAATRLDAAADASARGNLKVFEEIAREFARFLALPADGLDGFDAALRPGEPPEGQRLLRQAFTHYHQATSTTDPKARAELLLLANVEIGLHEQTRLQPEITAALQAPVLDPRDLERRLLDQLLPGNRAVKWLRRVLLTVLGRRTPLRLAGEHLADHARALARRAVTEHLMTLALPGGDLLDLSEDLPSVFPPLLAELSHPELLALLETVDPTPDDLLGTAARDWSDLPDRMHYIADMFRCHAHRTDLLDPPFTPDQIAALTDGHRPTGPL